MTSPDDKCANCGHPRSYHYDAVDAGDTDGCHYLHRQSGACGSHSGQPPFGNGNTTRCLAFVEARTADPDAVPPGYWGTVRYVLDSLPRLPAEPEVTEQS